MSFMKTKMMIFYHSRRHLDLDSLAIDINGVVVELGETFKYLRLHLDRTLTWSEYLGKWAM